MRIGIDIDDVLYPWYDVTHRVCERAGITNGVSPCTWAPFEEYGCTDEQWFEALADATLTGELYEAPPFDGVRDQLQRLVDAGHTVHLVTARGFLAHGTVIREATVQWLAKWDIPHHSLTFAKDKRAVITDVFLDDAPHNYDQLDGHTQVWLLHASHNGSHRDGRRTAASVAEFVDLVLGGAITVPVPPNETVEEWGFDSPQTGLLYVTTNPMLAETMHAARPDSRVYHRWAGPWELGVSR